jgi:hypothetical protein
MSGGPPFLHLYNARYAPLAAGIAALVGWMVRRPLCPFAAEQERQP